MVKIDLIQIFIIVLVLLFIGSVSGYIQNRSITYERFFAAGSNTCKRCLYKCGAKCLEKDGGNEKRKCFRKCPRKCKNRQKCHANLLVDISRHL